MSYTRGDLLGELPSSSSSTPLTLSTGGEGVGENTPRDSVAQGKAKLYRIVDGEESKVWRLGMIGSGGHTFCINKDCSVKHRGGEKFPIETSHLYVLKEPRVGFVAPSVESSDLTMDLQSTWLNSAKTWSEWAKLFGMVKSMEGMSVPGLGLGVREEDLIEQEARDSEARTEAFRTPFKKRGREQEENLGDAGPEMYSPVLKDDLAVSPDILASCLRKVEEFVRDKFSRNDRRFDELENLQEMGST